VACNSQFDSACRVRDAQGGVANARNSYGYCCAAVDRFSLALHAGRASFPTESTVTGH